MLSATHVETRIEASVARGLKELVGRDDELEALRLAFEKAKRGEAQVVDIVGEAGSARAGSCTSSKSHRRGSYLSYRGECPLWQERKLLPVIDVVRALLAFRRG